MTGDTPPIEQEDTSTLASYLSKVPGVRLLKRQFERLGTRGMDVIMQLTRVTNDGSYQSMRKAQRTTGAQPKREGRAKRGLPGG